MMPSKKRSVIFFTLSIVIVAVSWLIFNEICYQAIVKFRKYETLVTFINFARYLVSFVTVFFIFPVYSYIESKYKDMIMTKRYGANWIFLTTNEINMIEKIVLESEKNLNPVSSVDPSVQQEAKRRISEKNNGIISQP